MTGGARTIAAVATPPGAGGVGIVRLSGPRAAAIVAALLGRAEESLADRQLVHGVARDPVSGERLDDVLAVVMRGPRSYTGEDVGELHGHGGALNVARLLRATLAAGAQLAEPGEFTRRAFERGRLDLTRAEAVADVIGAASERALRVAQAQLEGALGAHVAALRGRAVALLGEVEASIDFPEEDLSFLPNAEVAAQARALADEVAALAKSYGVGRALREGLTVALVGAPNVGKSSLLNALAGEERALVAAEPGTTRDWVEARVVWSGIAVTVIDTAGERDEAATASAVERRGMALGRARAAQADVVLRVRDATVAGAPGATAEEEVAAGAAGQGGGREREIEVWNKIDLQAPPGGSLGVSATTGAGLDALRAAVLARVAGTSALAEQDGELVTTERQKQLVDEAAAALARGAAAATAGRPPELTAADLRAAAGALARIHGVEVGEHVLDYLFGRFCIGK